MNLPLGYKYSSVYAGIRKVEKDDLGLIVSDAPANAAGDANFATRDGNTVVVRFCDALEVQIQGRKRISAEAFLNGHHLTENEILGVTA